MLIHAIAAGNAFIYIAFNETIRKKTFSLIACPDFCGVAESSMPGRNDCNSALHFQGKYI
jgi:hypothetical protein